MLLSVKLCNQPDCLSEALSYNPRCREHYNAYMADYMLTRYHRRRAQYVAEWGGRCVDCGTTENLEFDHVDSGTKQIDVGKMFVGYSDAHIRDELEKCVLRCDSCHIVKSNKFDWRTVDHGGGMTGKKNCYCELCGPLKRAYQAQRRASKTLVV